jgi:ankyrin repeat protein
VDLAEYLLGRGAAPDLSGTGYTALHWAVGSWETSFTEDYRGSEPEWAAARGLSSPAAKARLVKALVAHGADLNARMRNDALRTGFTLIMSHAPSILRKAGATPFFVAAQSGDASSMRLLVALGADPSIRNANNSTPAMMAAGRLRIDHESRIREEDALAATKLALELGDDVNAVNDEGETALHAAVMAGFDSVIEYLIERGATVDAQTAKGRTPLDIAENGYTISGGMVLIKRPTAAALLRKMGAK